MDKPSVDWTGEARKAHGIKLGGTARKPEQVYALRDLGLSFAEVPIPDPEVFDALTELYNEAREATGLYYLCHGPREGDPNNIAALEQIYFQKLVKTLELMPALRMRLITVHLWMDTRFVQEDVIAYKIRLLSKLTAMAGAGGITVCVENLSEGADDLAPVLRAVPDLRLTLDVGHAQLLTDRNTSFPIVASFPDRIRHLHVHDNRGGHTPGDDLHLPVGEGRIDFLPIFEALRAAGYGGTLTLELRPEEIRGCLETTLHLLKRAGLGLGGCGRP